MRFKWGYLSGTILLLVAISLAIWLFNTTEVENSSVRSIDESVSVEVIEDSRDPKEIEQVTKRVKTNTSSHSMKLIPVTPIPKEDDFSINVEFPNGEVLLVKYKQYVAEGLPFRRTDKLSEMYDALVDAAQNGNGGASFFLHQSLQNCFNSPRTKSQRDDQLMRLEKEGHITVKAGNNANDSRVVDVNPNDYERYRVLINQSYSFCKGISDSQLDNPGKWLEKSAGSGYYPSAQKLAVEQRNTQEGFIAFKELWDKGYIGTGFAISSQYLKGIPVETDGQPDYVNAYAYMLAVNTIWKPAFMRSSSPSASNRIAALDEALQGLGAYINPQQQLEAEELAWSLIRENQNCCLGSWYAF